MRFVVAPLLLALSFLPVDPGGKQGLSNPFYAMDTAFRRPGSTLAQQLDLLKELGYAGIAWTGVEPEEAQRTAREAEQRGLKLLILYCPATVTAEGDLTYSPN